MKKSFNLTSPKKKPAQQTDSVKHEIKKYIKRERNKKLPDGVDFWDFDCKLGDNPESAVEIHLSEINKCIDAKVAGNKESFYIEVLVKPGHRAKKAE